MKASRGPRADAPTVVNLATLPQAPGSVMSIARTIKAPEEFGTEVIGVRAGEPLEVDGRVEAVSEGVLVTATVRSTAYGECIRCLDQVTADIDVSFQELYYYPQRADAIVAEDPEIDPEDIARLEGDLLDLEPLLRDVVIPTLPFSPLCRVDCPGLCAECGARLADEPPGHHHETTDPRWAGLQGFASVSDDVDTPGDHSAQDQEKRK